MLPRAGSDHQHVRHKAPVHPRILLPKPGDTRDKRRKCPRHPSIIYPETRLVSLAWMDGWPEQDPRWGGGKKASHICGAIEKKANFRALDIPLAALQPVCPVSQHRVYAAYARSFIGYTLGLDPHSPIVRFHEPGAW